MSALSISACTACDASSSMVCTHHSTELTTKDVQAVGAYALCPLMPLFFSNITNSWVYSTTLAVVVDSISSICASPLRLSTGLMPGSCLRRTLLHQMDHRPHFFRELGKSDRMESVPEASHRIRSGTNCCKYMINYLMSVPSWKTKLQL